MSARNTNPEALFDSLVIVRELDRILQGVSRLEIQKLAFLACILSLYRGKPASEWGYQFARTPFGTPFSRQIDSACDILIRSGELNINSMSRMTLTDDGKELIQQLEVLENCSRRLPYLKSATTSLLVVPPGTFMRGLDNEPTTNASSTKARGATLLDGPAAQLLYDDFASLSSIFDDSADLITPSVVWLTCSADEPVSQPYSQVCR